ncbi:MAG: hypothetical protein DRO11_10010 [Methanobacteriota archaeon]|nr:MAG: hypothetical protein DRO11_10010 [Euryarchaeota archaeon]
MSCIVFHKSQVGCWADSTYGFDHVSDRIIDLLDHHLFAFDEEHRKQAEDIISTYKKEKNLDYQDCIEALYLLDLLCEEGVGFQLCENGSLILTEKEEE